MVRWLDPHQLVDTAVRVLLSGVFSAYADYRELQALEPYTVARLLATEGLKLDWDGETYASERGRILIMGGDQMYPVPKAAALPCAAGPISTKPNCDTSLVLPSTR